MLTSEQSIVAFDRGRVIVDRLTQNRHRHYLRYAQQMLAVYREGVGRQRQSLHRQIEALFADEQDCPIRRIEAFCRLLDDKGTFQTDAAGRASHLRMTVFAKAASCHPLVQTPDRLFQHSETETKARIATELGTTWGEIGQALYADVISHQRLEHFEGYRDSQALLSRYNVAQLQACLYRAEQVTITATDDFKAILRYAKLAKLLVDVTRLNATTYRMVLTGPALVLGHTRRYGTSFAQFLPSLLSCGDWHMIALVQTPWKGRATLSLSDKDGLHSHLPPPEEFDSSVEAALAEKFGTERNGWRMVREAAILHDRQKTFIPDFVFRHEDGTEVLLEIVGFWRPEYLARRRETLQAFGRRHNILIAVPKASLREGAVPTDRVIVYKTAITLGPLLAALESFRSRVRL
jgi:predicted nuclease of restriction endonuclease-like RecB superfamily